MSAHMTLTTYNWPLEPVDNTDSPSRCVVLTDDGVSMEAWPFIGTEAIACGAVSPRTLKRDYDRIYRNVYGPKGVVLTPAQRAKAAWLWSDRQATVAGLSAASLHGSQWIDPKRPAELYRRNGKPVAGILIHRDELPEDEHQLIRGIPATTAARTAFDLGRRRGRTMAVVNVDALANATGLQPGPIQELIGRHPGVRGLRQLREVLELMDGGAESPQETRTRLVLVDAGLPKPETQIRVGRWRIDMGYREFKVGVEYDGEQHWTDPRRRAHDIDRHAELAALGWVIVRVSADILRYRRHVIVERTCVALRAAGAEWPVIARILGQPGR
jgi:very-short-patch-repair endonuclease